MQILFLLLLSASSLLCADQTPWEKLFVEGGRAVAERRYDVAEKAYWAAIEQLKDAADSTDHLADTLHVLAILYTLEGRYREAEPLCTRALALRESIDHPDDPAIVPILLTLGTISRVLGRYPEAERWTRRAIAMEERRADPQNPDLGTAYYNLALDLFAQHSYAEAERIVNRAVDAFWLVERNEAAQAASLQGRIYAARKRYRDSEACHRRALALLERAHGPSHPTLVPALTSFAEMYLVAGRFPEAENVSRHALAIATNSIGESHADWAAAALVLAEALTAQKSFVDAEPYFQRSLPVLERTLGSQNSSFAYALRAYARLLLRANRASEARVLDARASAILNVSNQTVGISGLRQR